MPAASASRRVVDMREPEGPLSRESIARIDATQLPQLERHHLRLLAHCLACFQTMEPTPSDGSLPRETSRRQWCLEQPRIAEDPDFLDRLLEQFDVAALQLETIAQARQVPPLTLTLDALITAAETHCQHRNLPGDADVP